MVIATAKFEQVQHVDGQRRHVALDPEHASYALRRERGTVRNLHDDADRNFFSERYQHASADVISSDRIDRVIEQR